MELTAEQIQNNWDKLMKYIGDNVGSSRKKPLLELYEKYGERIALMPASYKTEYHNAFPGGYVDHVIRVIECAWKQHKIWEEMGVDISTYTKEELFFSALNHDLGKIGDEQYESYIPQDDAWRKNKLGEVYKFNTKLPFASVPDRSLFILQSNNISYSFNEMVSIQTHDGLYDEGNKKYLMAWSPEQKPRSALPFIIHQADLMASRIEFERVWLPIFKAEEENLDKLKKSHKLSKGKEKKSIKEKALSTVGSNDLQNILKNL